MNGDKVSMVTTNISDDDMNQGQASEENKGDEKAVTMNNDEQGIIAHFTRSDRQRRTNSKIRRRIDDETARARSNNTTKAEHNNLRFFANTLMLPALYHAEVTFTESAPRTVEARALPVKGCCSPPPLEEELNE
jgi:MarR-like DNA-binding transcriptional regulator SgrR of sgrS sRNA